MHPLPANKKLATAGDPAFLGISRRVQRPKSQPKLVNAKSQALVVFSRVGVYIRVPGVDVDRFAESMRGGGGGLLGYIDQLSGGSISKVGLFSLGAHWAQAGRRAGSCLCSRIAGPPSFTEMQLAVQVAVPCDFSDWFSDQDGGCAPHNRA